MFSDGDYVGGGEDRFFFPGNAEITIEGDAAEFTVSVDGGNLGDDFRFQFAAPEGQRLGEGDYERTQAPISQTATRPGLEISGAGRGCSEATGRFRVKRITEGPSGITSVWIIFEQRCSFSFAALYGEVRYNVQGEDLAVVATPRWIRWPDNDVGQGTIRPIPVPVVNPSAQPESLGASFVEGDAAADYDVRIDRCEGVILAPGEKCTVWVGYVPGAPGTRLARLVIPGTTGGGRTVTLEGFAFGGTSRFVVRGDPGDPVAGASYYDVSPRNARLIATGDHEKVEAYIFTRKGIWELGFDAPDGDVLVPGGTYTDVDVYDSSEELSAQIKVWGNDSACSATGRFTVSEIAVDQFGELEEFGVSFEHHCLGRDPATQGILDFRVEEPNIPPERYPSYRRTVSLALGRGSVSGTVKGVGPSLCQARARVKIFLLSSGQVPRVVARGLTGRSGGYRIEVRPLDGHYRAVAPVKQLGDGTICREAISRDRSTG